jgi:hypothetical protein
MRTILLGHDAHSGEDVRIPESAFATHFHLIGGTGKGKTTAIHTMLQPLLSDPFHKNAFFIIDRLGNFSQELLLWISSRFCPEHVRKRLVYVQPSREDLVSAFNPLLYDTPAHGYFRVERATEIILRAWESVNIEAMPRLARWVFNTFWAAAQLGLTISDCAHFLLPGSPHHAALLNLLPQRLKAEWEEITTARGQEATRILDSSRNRLKPYFESDILRRMFGSAKSRLDVTRMMREGRIVIIDLAPRNRLSTQLANTIGSLLINEVIATIRSLPRGVKYPSYLFLDEFQNFVGPDVEAALPETRQLGLKLVLSHQSFAQLERGDYDLTSMIFAAQSRMIFGVQGEDADLLANEVASITYDPARIKHEIWTRRQLTKGQKLVMLHSRNQGQTRHDQESESESSQSGRTDGRSGPELWLSRSAMHDPVLHEGKSENKGNAKARMRGNSTISSEGEHETLVPEYDEFRELSSRTYESFNEQRSVWARDIRNLRTGQALLRLVNEPKMRLVNVKRSAPGILGHDIDTLARKFPQAIERMEQLIEENFRSDFFVPAAEIDREQEERLKTILASGRPFPDATPPSSDVPFS